MNAATPRRRGRGTGGFAMISAVFIVVVLALLGAMIVNLSSAQQVGQTRDVLGSRAYFMARAGLEWGVYAALGSGLCNANSVMPGSLSPMTGGLGVTVACQAFGPYDEGGTTFTVYQITSTATRGTLGSLDYTDRQLVATVSSQ